MNLIYSHKNNLQTDFYLNFKDEVCIFVDNELFEVINRDNLYTYNDNNLIKFNFENISYFSEIDKDYLYLICKYILLGFSDFDEVYEFANNLVTDFNKKILDEVFKDYSSSYYYFSDNIRLCIENETFYKVYKYREKKGCCGKYEKRIKIKNKILLFGFNFGH